MDHHTRFTAKMPEVMRLISRGITCSQVTSQNGVWVHTVTSLNKCAYRKLNVQAAATALMRAVQLWFFGEGGSSSPKVQSGSDKTTNWMTRLRIAALAPLVLALSSCGGGGGDGDGDSGNGGPCSPAPQITSVPPTVATVGERYSY